MSEKSLTHFSDSEDSDDNMYRPAAGISDNGTYRPVATPGEKRSTRLSDSEDSDNGTHRPPADEKRSIIEQSQCFGSVGQEAPDGVTTVEEGSTSSRPAAGGGDGLVSDDKSTTTAVTPQQGSGDAGPPHKGILKRLYDRWFDSTATKRGSSLQPDDGDTRARKH